MTYKNHYYTNIVNNTMLLFFSLIFIFSNSNTALAQGTPLTLGNNTMGSGASDGFLSSLVINKTDTYTNTTAVYQSITINQFYFYTTQLADPVTPFIVKINGDNDFTVLHIGTTRTSAEYVLGINSFDYADGGANIVLNPNETIAVGFLDGSGSGSGSVVPFDQNQGNEVWYSGSGSSSSASISVGNSPTPIGQAHTTLLRNYDFNISFLISETTNEMVMLNNVPLIIPSLPSYEVEVDYVAEMSRDIVVEFWSASGWLTATTTTVNAGIGTITVTVTLPSPPPPDEGYYWKAQLRPVGTTWMENIDINNVTGITVVAVEESVNFNNVATTLLSQPSYTVNIDYVAGANRDIAVEFWSANNWIAATAMPVATGSGTLSVTVDLPAPQPAGTDYTWKGSIRPTGTDWMQNIDTDQVNNITIVDTDSIAFTDNPTQLSPASSYAVNISYVAITDRDLVIEFWSATGWIATTTMIVPPGSGNETITVDLPATAELGGPYLWKASIRPVGGDWTQTLQLVQHPNVMVVCLEDITLTTPLQINETIHANNSVVTLGDVTATNTEYNTIKAGNCVLLNAGFEVDLNVNFEVSIEGCSQGIKIEIDPYTLNSIKGNLALDRGKYLVLGTSGNNFENKISDPATVTTFLDDYQMNFGRSLGMVGSQVRWGNSVFEDPNRPGYMDLQMFQNQVNVDNSASPDFLSRWTNLDAAYHDYHNPFPDFMPTYSAPQKPEEVYPSNTTAAAEMTVEIIKHAFNDFNRPGTFEVVNEPHWSIWGDQRFADLHTAVWQEAQNEQVSTEIGGPCFAVGYFYRNNYNDLNGFTNFIDNTSAQLDFYSFHIYDFLHWDANAQDFNGRITTGLPLEGVLDAIQNYTTNTYQKEVPIVLSEHGGYLLDGLTDAITDPLVGPGTDFNHTMLKRSIDCRLMTRSVISNTMTFMNNPHIIRKSAPFILLQSAGWDPYYYSSLMVAEDFQNGNPWVVSELIQFYQLFAEVKGNRVLSSCEDPDIQYHTFVDGNELFVILNNLGEKEEAIDLQFTDENFQSIRLKRHGQNENFTPYFNEENPTTLDDFVLNGREAVVIKLTYPSPLVATQSYDVIPHYSNSQRQEIQGGQSATFNIAVPEFADAQHATLRIAIGRSAGAGHDLNVTFNNQILNVPLEDIADYLEDDENYGSTKIIKVDPALLQANNTINVSFTDNQSGGIGSVVLRVGS